MVKDVMTCQRLCVVAVGGGGGGSVLAGGLRDYWKRKRKEEFKFHVREDQESRATLDSFYFHWKRRNAQAASRGAEEIGINFHILSSSSIDEAPFLRALLSPFSSNLSALHLNLMSSMSLLSPRDPSITLSPRDPSLSISPDASLLPDDVTPLSPSPSTSSLASSASSLPSPVILVMFSPSRLPQEAQRIFGYLRIIQRESPKSKILFVGTYADDSALPPDEAWEVCAEWINRKFRDILRDLCVIGLIVIGHNGEGIADVARHLEESLRISPPACVPRPFLLLESFILSLRRVTHLPLLSPRKLLSLASHCFVRASDLWSCLQFLFASAILGCAPSRTSASNVVKMLIVTDLRSVIEYYEPILNLGSSAGYQVSSQFAASYKDMRVFQSLQWMEAVLPMWDGGFLMAPGLPECIISSEFTRKWFAGVGSRFIFRRHFILNRPVLDLIPRLLSRTLGRKSLTVVSFWRHGCFLSRDGDEFASLLLFHCDDLLLFTPSASHDLSHGTATFLSFLMAMEDLLVNGLEIGVTQKVLCPHCLPHPSLIAEIESFLQIISPMPNSITKKGVDNASFIPDLSFDNRLFHQSNASLYFDVASLKPVFHFDAPYVQCPSGAYIDMCDVVPEFSIPNDVALLQSAIHNVELLANGIETVILRGFVTPRGVVKEVEGYSDETSSAGDVRVAIKTLRSEPLSFLSEFTSVTPESSSWLSDAKKEMYREFYILRRVTHPNIVQLRGSLPRPLALVMEYLDGGSLFVFLSSLFRSSSLTPSEEDFQSQMSLPKWDEKVKIAADVAAAMAHLHSLRLIHCDLKSPNVLLSSPGDRHVIAKVTDFGNCVSFDFAGSLRSSRVDNPRWLPPELLMDSPYDEKVDVYAFGKA